MNIKTPLTDQANTRPTLGKQPEVGVDLSTNHNELTAGYSDEDQMLKAVKDLLCNAGLLNRWLP